MKLDDRGLAMILVIYHSLGAYKLLSPIENSVVNNKDVEFDEHR